MDILKRKKIYLITVLFVVFSINTMEEDEGKSKMQSGQEFVNRQLMTGMFLGGCRSNIPMGICCKIAVLPYCDKEGVIRLPDIYRGTIELIAQMDEKASCFDPGFSLYEKFVILHPLLRKRLQSQFQVTNLLFALKKLGMSYFDSIVMRVLANRVVCGRCYQQYRECRKGQRILRQLKKYNPKFNDQLVGGIAELICERSNIKYCDGTLATTVMPVCHIDGLPLTYGFLKRQIFALHGLSNKKQLRLLINGREMVDQNSQMVLPDGDCKMECIIY